MSIVSSRREEVLEELYNDLLVEGLDEFLSGADNGDNGENGNKRCQQAVALVVALENARQNERNSQIKERELALKEEELTFENARHEIEMTHNDNRELVKLLVTAGITLVTNSIWAVLFIHELEQTRMFEVNGTETSAAGRWLKNSFPKVKLF